jgi:hypothetical protein
LVPVQQQFDHNTLTLHGFDIDTVTATSLASCKIPAIFEWENPSWSDYLKAIVNLANPQYLSHHYTASAAAVLCRTLIAHAINGAPAADSVELSFLRWLVYMVGRPGSLERVTGEAGSEKWKTFTHLINGLGTLTTGPLFDTRAPWRNITWEIYRFVERLMTNELGDALRLMTIASWNQKLTEFNLAYGAVMEGRKLFRTGKGLLGLGTASVKLGDEVWAIENAQMLMVLRASRTKDGRQLMEFVGDGYVHGCMCGEIFPALGTNIESREVNII